MYDRYDRIEKQEIMKKAIVLCILVPALILTACTSPTPTPAKSYILTIAVDGNGDTNPEPGTYTYEEATQVTISALPWPACRFDHWGGDASGTSMTIIITIDSNKSVIAYFKPAVTGSDVQIANIFYKGLVPDVESDEYVEIKNLGDLPEDLFRWVLINASKGHPSFRFPQYYLDPGETIRVYTNEVHPEWGGFSFESDKAIWDNTKPDTAVLYDGLEHEVSRKSY